jgi:hypothetical protein
MSLSTMLFSNSSWIKISKLSFGLLSFSICLNISENAINLSLALLIYLDIYCKVTCILRIGLTLTFALHLCNCNLLCGLMYGSFLEVTNSSYSWLSLCNNVLLLISFRYLNLHTSFPCFVRIQYEVLHIVYFCSLLINST